MHTHAEIVEILNGEVYSATTRLVGARHAFDALLADASGEVLYFDQRFKIMDAAWEHQQARKALRLATTRNSEFTFNGTVPEDVK
jgi:hypothetical protein